LSADAAAWQVSAPSTDSSPLRLVLLMSLAVTATMWRSRQSLAQNITALKGHESAVRERHLLRLLDALPIAVKIVDADGLGRHFNPTWLRLIGRSPDATLDRSWMEHGHPLDRSNCERAYKTALASQQPMTVEYRVLRPDGTCRWLLDHVVPRYSDEGQFTGLLGACLDVTEHRIYEEKLRALRAQLVSAQEDERCRIARELHDDVNQRVALLAIGIDLTSSTLLDQGSRDRMQDLRRQTIEISKVVHGLSHRLHSSTLDVLGLVPAVRALSRELSAAGLQMTLTTDDDDCCDLSPAAALGLFRITQEALSNVLKHSGVMEADVKVRHSQHMVIVRVEDHGCGFNSAIAVGGLGLRSMRERLTPIGGDVNVRSRPGEGTTIEGRVPRTKTRTTRPNVGRGTLDAA
jgi:PAS domain S-box-containing protein